MQYFLQNIPCHIHIYTEESFVDQMTQLRKTFFNTTRIIVKPFADLKMAKKYGTSVFSVSLSLWIWMSSQSFFDFSMTLWRNQKMLDHEPYHTPELYAIWNEKLNFLTESIANNTFDSDYFLWTDIGCFRDYWQTKDLVTYPDIYTTSRALGREKVFFLQVDRFSAAEMVANREGGFLDFDFRLVNRLAGTVLGGHKDAVLKYAEKYYKTMDVMRQRGRFIGKDQNIMATVAVLYPELVHLVPPEEYWVRTDRDGVWAIGNAWFYSLFYFTSDKSKESVAKEVETSFRPLETDLQNSNSGLPELNSTSVVDK